MTTYSNNRATVITGCAPSPSCTVCQEGRKRLRHIDRNGIRSTTKFEHITKVGDAYKLVECQDQRPPEADLTKSF